MGDLRSMIAEDNSAVDQTKDALSFEESVLERTSIPVLDQYTKTI